jgi:glucosamine-6-phosphate deaminase
VLLKVFNDRIVLGQAAAEQASAAIRRALAERGQARIIAATAASQLEFLDALTRAPGIDWLRVEVFHLDEYIGLPVAHPGSFRKMLVEQLVRKTGIVDYHLLDGDAADPLDVVRREEKQYLSVRLSDGCLLASARTDTSHSTIHLPTSRLRNLTSS